MAFFDFLYDDEAPGPLEQIGSAVKSITTSARESADQAMQTDTGKHVKTAASTGLVLGVGLGVTILVAGTAYGLVNKVFGSTAKD